MESKPMVQDAPMHQAPELTQWLQAWSDGQDEVFEEIAPLVYQEIRAIARSRIRRERPGHPWHTTDLAHEAFLALQRRKRIRPESRSHFFAAVSRVMRNLLVDQARKASAQQRDVLCISFEDAFPISEGREIAGLEDGASEFILEVRRSPAYLLDLHRALKKIEQQNPFASKIFEMDYYGGYTQQEIAKSVGLSERTVRRRLDGTRRRLKREMNAET